MAKEDLIAGKNRKPGGKRTTIVLSGAARALANLHGETMAQGIESALVKVSTLADKVKLIHDGLWGMPEFSDHGIMIDSGFEDLNYEPSNLVLRMVDNLEDFFDGTVADRSDPINLQMAIEKWGFTAVYEIAKNYAFDGWANDGWAKHD